MSKNIFSISDWSSDMIYAKDDIIYYNGQYYYAMDEHNASAIFNIDLQNGHWGGILTDFDGIDKPYFVWKPSYTSTVDHNPKVKSIRFGDGYEQRVPDGINNLFLEFDLTFDQLDINEYTAILHFLYSCKGSEAFLYIPPPPYDNLKKFVCRSWNGTFNSFNNYSIKARFEEVAV